MQTTLNHGSPADKRSIRGLDGLRGIAILLVIVAHLQLFHQMQGVLQTHGLPFLAELFAIDPGDLGVSVFFVISGFLITTLLMKELDTSGILLKRFYLRRLFRIFPPYYVYLACIALLSFTHYVQLTWGTWLSAFTYTSNYYPYRLSHPESTGWLVGHSWSLSLEEQFYCLWPACLSLFKKQRSLAIGVALLVLAPIARVATLHFFPGTRFDEQIYRMFHTRIDTIMAGCVLALGNTLPAFQSALRRATAWRWSAPLASTLLLINLIAGVHSQNYRMVFGLSAECVLLAFLIFYCTGKVPKLLDSVLNGRALRHIGAISYSLYLWQQLYTGPVNLFGRHRAVIPILIASFVSAEISYYLVEKTSNSLRDRWMRPRA